MKRLLAVLVVGFGWCQAARAYVDVSPTLGSIIRDSSNILVLRVDKVSQDKRIIIYKKVADLKGQHAGDEVRHQLGDGLHPREPQTILDWAVPGQTAICFHNGKLSLTCIGPFWYQCAAQEAPWWSMTRGAAELSLAYFGSPSKLRQHLTQILAGKEAVITAIRYTEEDRGRKFVVMSRNLYRGKDFPVWRIKASLQMPGQAYEIARTPGAVVGQGAGGAEDVPRLVALLKDADAGVRLEAAIDLGLIGPPARTAAPALRAALKDVSAPMRIAAAEALARIDPTEASASATLIEALKDTDRGVRRTAAYALGNLGADAKSAVPALTQALRDADAGVRATAADTLGRVGPDAAPAVPALVAALKEPALRGIVADALGSIGPAAKAATAELAKVLPTADENVQWIVAIALVRIDPHAAKPAVPLFVRGLTGGNERFRLDAISQLSVMGPAAKDAIPALIQRTQAGDILAAACLVSVARTEATAAIPLLVGQLPSDAWDVSGLLAEIGPASAPAIIAALKDASGVGAQRGTTALGLIGRKSPEVLPALLATLKHRDPHGRLGAAAALGSLDPKPKEAVPALIEALRDDNPWVRLTAASSLVAIDGLGQAKNVVPTLSADLKHAEFWVRRSAASRLADLGLAAKEAAPALKAKLQDADLGVRTAAAWALVKVANLPARQAVPVFSAALKDKDTWTRQMAASYLGQLGPAALDAVPALKALTQDESEPVRQAAAAALQAIQPK